MKILFLYPKPIQKLIDIFTKFPGIGPRQAGRFAFFILNPVRNQPRRDVGAAHPPSAERHSNAIKENNDFVDELIEALKEVKEKVSFCARCFRSMESQEKNLCGFCRDSKRDQAIIAVVEKEADMQNLEKTGLHQGVYHILGGVISPLDNDSPKKLHLKEMYGRIKNMLEKNSKCEVILATSSTVEGDTTALYIERVLEPLKKQYADFKISRLGRGLSLGSELEYADEITLKNALTNRR